MIKFKGWDWSELYQLKQIASKNLWPKKRKIDEKDRMIFYTEKEQQMFIEIIEYLNTLHSVDKERKRVCKYIRKFLLKLSNGPTYDSPVFLGMSKIEEDEVLIRWVNNNLGSLWT